MKTLLLDTETWDLAVDLSNNIAVASEPYSQAQDAASSIRLFAGELYYDTSRGIPYFQEILGQSPPISLMKNYFDEAALVVPGVVSSQSFITEWTNRVVRGQVQITTDDGQSSAASF